MSFFLKTNLIKITSFPQALSQDIPRSFSSLQLDNLILLSCQRIQCPFWSSPDDLTLIQKFYIYISMIFYHTLIWFVFLFLCRTVIHRTLTAVVSRGWWRPITRVSNLCVSTDPPTSPLLLTMWPGRSTVITVRDVEHVGRRTRKCHEVQCLQYCWRNSYEIHWTLVKFQPCVWAALQWSVKGREEIKINVLIAMSPERNQYLLWGFEHVQQPQCFRREPACTMTDGLPSGAGEST